MALNANRQPSIAVYLETGKRRVFACALDWPGWCRSGRNAQQALEALAAAAPRYQTVAAAAGLDFPRDSTFEVVERLTGTATTDFGAPDVLASLDVAPLSPEEAERLAALVTAAWAIFDTVVASAPPTLRKGPRGGGRDRDAIVAHVLGAEAAYARKLGIRLKQPDIGDAAAIAMLRAAIITSLRAAPDGAPNGRGWPARYAARRIAWHVLDHAWEIEDRRQPSLGTGTADDERPARAGA